MQLSEIRTKTRTLIGNPSQTSIPDSRLTELINQAYRDIATRYRFHKVRTIATFATVDGTKRYTLPTDCGVLMKVWDQTSRKKLGKLDNRDFSEKDAQDTGITSQPTNYYRTRDWIELFPIPDGVYTIAIQYKTTIADMVADADTPAIPLPWHIGICYYARWVYYDEEGNLEKTQYYLNQWNLCVNTMPVEVDEELFADMDKGVRLPELAEWRGSAAVGLDFDHSE